MTWSELDWSALDRLRAGFLSSTPASGAYWQSASDLASYDFTYGERIGWKWDHVLRELRLRGWRPASRRVLDWGCGSGIASRRLISFFGVENFDELTVWDHAPFAASFAEEAAQREFSSLRVAQATPGFLSGDEPLGLLIISHVLNELSPEQLDELRRLVTRADAVIWVEPGTHQVSRQLGRLRDEFLACFSVVAPCTHQNPCPMFTPGRERDWCHFFAPPPSVIFADSNWVKFGQRAGIDLRSLPYCFIALDRSQKTDPVAAADDRRADAAEPPNTNDDHRPPPQPDHQEGLSRVIGRPEHFKPYARLLNCDANGLADLELPKRSAPALYKELERTKAPLIYRWRREGDKILGGEAVEPHA